MLSPIKVQSSNDQVRRLGRRWISFSTVGDDARKFHAARFNESMSAIDSRCPPTLHPTVALARVNFEQLVTWHAQELCLQARAVLTMWQVELSAVMDGRCVVEVLGPKCHFASSIVPTRSEC